MSEELFLCQCGSPDHVFYVEYDEEWKEVFMYAHLRKKSFWNRLKYGIKYIFGYQSRYGAFDEVILRQEDLHKLQKIIDKMKPLPENGDKNNE